MPNSHGKAGRVLRKVTTMTRQYLSKTPIVTRDKLGLLLNLENHEWLQDERPKHNTADRLGKKECQMCGFCCLRRTCTPSLKEFKEIANFLEILPKELARKYSVVDTDDKGSLHIKWANEAQLDLTGTFLSCHRTYDKGYCIFFNKKTHQCKIYLVRPKTAKTCECWSGHGVETKTPKWSKRSILELLPKIQLDEDYPTNPISSLLSTLLGQ